jgi:type II secretory pathway component HofQ
MSAPSAISAALSSAWDAVVSRPGVLRNASHASTQRRLLGDDAATLTHNALVQFNEEHIKTKRPASSAAAAAANAASAATAGMAAAGAAAAQAAPAASPGGPASPTSPSAARVSRPFDGARFNFNRVSPDENIAFVRVSEDAAAGLRGSSLAVAAGECEPAHAAARAARTGAGSVPPAGDDGGVAA